MIRFGDYLQELRLKTGRTLREFCITNGFDVVNFSKYERNILIPNPLLVIDLIHALGFNKETKEYKAFMDLWSKAENQPPLKEEDILKKLPLFICGKEKPTKEQLKKIYKLVKKAYC